MEALEIEDKKINNKIWWNEEIERIVQEKKKL